jgi:hypothetical protein
MDGGNQRINPSVWATIARDGLVTLATAAGYFSTLATSVPKAFDLRVGQSPFLRLQRHGDGERFLPSGNWTFVDVEQTDFETSLRSTPQATQQGISRKITVDDKGEIALDRLEYRSLSGGELGPAARTPHRGTPRSRQSAAERRALPVPPDGIQRRQNLRPEPQDASPAGWYQVARRR